MFNFFKKQNATARLVEEKLYEKAVFEVNAGDIRPGLWAKSLAHSGGDEVKAKAYYLTLRVQSMIDESEFEQAAANKAQADISAKEKEEAKEQAELERQRIKRLKKNARAAGAKYIER